MQQIPVYLLVAALVGVRVHSEDQCPLPEKPVDAAAALCEGQCTGSNMYYCKPIDATKYECICKAGYRYNKDSGTCININECEENLHDCDRPLRAKCLDTIGSYTCQCNTPNFTGDGHLCRAEDTYDCKATCPSDQFCLKMTYFNINFDVCICQSGYMNSDFGCKDVDECADAKCDANAVCINYQPGYTCVCKPGYVGNGRNCQDKNECLEEQAGTDALCRENAECVNTEGSFKCVCQYGYTGDGDTCTRICPPTACEIFKAQATVAPPDVDECATEGQTLCPSDAVCVNTIGSYYCRCGIGYEWDETDRACKNINECELGVAGCAESWMAICEDTIGSYMCKCRDGFVGDGIYCANVAKTTCTKKCPANEFCYLIKDPMFVLEMCFCQSGYKNSDFGCTDIEECNDNPYPCDKNADCIERSPGYTCTCKDGYEGNGFYCLDKDECAPDQTNNCGKNANCINNDGSYMCQCKYGYTGDGVTCTSICPEPTEEPDPQCVPLALTDASKEADVDECVENPDICSTHALCENFLGSYTCHCMLGYEWDTENKKCVDVNECLRGRHDCMSVLATCTNTEGWYVCECIAPLTGNGRYCKAPSKPGCQPACPADKYCTVSAGGIASCLCQNGLKDDGAGGCIDVYECVKTGCHQHATCSELQPGFACTCDLGYEGNGIYCQDVNECVRGLHDCDNNAICKNTLGSYRCICRIGYVGNGKTCTLSCPVAVVPTPCDAKPCANGGTCVSAYETSTNYTCNCPTGFSGTTCSSVIQRRMYPYGEQTGDTKFCRMAGDTHTGQIPMKQGFQFFGNRHRSFCIHLYGFVQFDQSFEIVWSTPDTLSKTTPSEMSWMSPLYTIMGTYYTCRVDRTLVFYQVYEQLAPTQPVDDRTRYVMSLAKRDIATFTSDSSFVPSLVVVFTWYKSVRFPAIRYSSLPETLTYQLVLVSDISKTRSYAMFHYESLTWNSLSKTSIGYITPTAGDPIVYTHPDTMQATAATLDDRAGNTGEIGRWLYLVTAPENEVTKGAEYRCHMWRLRQMDSEAMIALGRLALPLCPCDRAAAEKDVRFTMKNTENCALSKISSGTGKMAQYCCYHDNGTLRTSQEFASGSLFLYHPTHYPTQHAEEDATPKDDCCKQSPVCDLYYEYRPQSTCVP